MMRATQELRRAVADRRLAGTPQYKLAQLAGFSQPSRLSVIVNGAVPVNPNDPKIARLLELLGMTFDAAFQSRPQVEAPGDGALTHEQAVAGR